MPERCRYCDRLLDPASPDHRRHRPFCSARCRMAELGHWFEGRYVVSRTLDDVADAAAPGPPDAGSAAAGDGSSEPGPASAAPGAAGERPDANDINT